MRASRRVFQMRVLSWLGGLAIAPAALSRTDADVLLARPAPAGLDPAPYLVSEKLDGVRALWDGSVLRFRSGRSIAAPTWFLARLPQTGLDGELWLGRGRFDALSATVRRAQADDAEWRRIRYMVFEMPRAEGDFSSRFAQLQNVVRTQDWDALRAVEQFRVANHTALQTKLKAVTAAGGEGLVLHLASAPVTTGRSDVLLKLKLVQDAEAVVLGFVPGRGKFTGMLGALKLRSESGQTFSLGTGLSEQQRRDPPAIGSRVTYGYQGLTSAGRPRFPRFLRVYQDD